MTKHYRSDLANITNIINEYIVTKQTTYLDEIENFMQEIFNVEKVKLWKYNQDLERLTVLGKDELSVTLGSSLTEQSTLKKEILISDHIISDKYYVPNIDNPFNFKAKAMIILPIMKAKKTLGVVKLWKGLKQRNNFTKNDIAMLESFAPLFMHMMEDEPVAKDELLQMTSKIKNDGNASKKNKKIASVASTSHQDEKQYNLIKSKLEALEAKYAQLLKKDEVLEKEKKDREKERKRLLDDLKKADQIKSDIEKYDNRINEYKQLLKESEDKSKTLEDSAKETIDEHQKIIKKLEEQVEELDKERKILKSELKEEKLKNSQESIENAKKKFSIQNKQNGFMDKNIEFLFQEIDEIFCDNESTYLLLEDIIYALNSKKDIDVIEEKLRSSKLLYDLIEDKHFLENTKINEEKFLIANLVKKLEKYHLKIFAGLSKLTIEVDEQMPTSLFMDAPKVQNILFHLLIDLCQFIDHTKPLYIGLSYKDKIFQVELNSSIHKKNTFFQAILKQSHIGKAKDRLSLEMAKKLIKIVGGDIEIEHQGNDYKFIVSFPLQVIKMS